MTNVRKSAERRHIANENQSTWMTFDRENKDDPLQGGFGSLKIFNEQILPPGSVFTLETHQDMVVMTYVQEGVIIYNGPLGKTGLVEPGDFLQINAAPGAKQYALNASPVDEAHVFQSGFAPGVGLLEPGGRKKLFTLAERKGVLKLIASPGGKESSLKIQQDVEMYSTLVHKGNHMIHEIKPGRKAWLHVVKGRISVNGVHLQTGDGAGFSAEKSVSFTAQEPSEVLLFDLA
jgi:redox-sensitive bicupin YhaK (pirin superfamily)